MQLRTPRTRNTILLLSSLITIAFLVFMFYYIRRQFSLTRSVLTEDMMIEKITAMGKLELVKYSIKDVLERKELRMILPDKRILFVAAGEVAGCIDLTKVKKEDIVKTGSDSLTINLPEPEICYFKLDHQRSKVYDVSGVWFPGDSKDMVEGIYKIAEKKMLQNAREQNILGKTKENATLIFKPMLENISGKKVGVVFR
jgi:hypothetical protein